MPKRGKKYIDALRRFEKGSRSSNTAPKKVSPADETMQLLAQGRTLDEVAVIRGRQRSTIVSMVSDLVERGEVKFQPGWVDQEKQKNTYLP